MKVLWLCNILLPMFAEAISVPAPTNGGWLTGAAKALSQAPDIELSICAGQRISSQMICQYVNGIRFFGYPSSGKSAHRYDEKLEKYFKELLQEVQPDLIHIWGTELPHTLAMVRSANDPDRILVNIQGLCGIYAGHYMAFLPYDKQKRKTLRDILRMDSLLQQRKNFLRRGAFEAEALRKVKHIAGRTRWDRALTKQLAPQATYHQCNETLRGSFYEKAGTWSIDACEKHSIFVSQSAYPIKGFHLALEALPMVLEKYPDAKLYTTGSGPFRQPWYRINGYQRLLKKQIMKLKLQDHVVFLSSLNEKKMCDRFLKSHAFVSASSIENSPNSVGEAMLLGVPTVASYVGGTMDLLKDGSEGLLYQADAPYMLAANICKVFADDALAEKLSSGASKHAQETHDARKNQETLMKIYEQIVGNGN